jgi:CheY-like chemotaxis protein
MKLLIVEDNLAIRGLLKSLVEPLANEIGECGDGRNAVAFYECERPDFVLMDIDLGEMDGITATRQIKAFDRDAKVIIVTSYDKSDLRAEANKAGACGYVLKENLFDVLELLQTPPKH